MRIVLAYSGGLDTTYCVAWLTRELDAEVVTVTVDTGGMDEAEQARIAERARAAGAVEHRRIDAWQAPPEDAWPGTGESPAADFDELTIGWETGLPVTLDGESLAGPELVEALDGRLAPYHIGRGIHLGETVLGIKGRIGFEAGAAQVLVAAHRELEKLVLTRLQSFWKDHLAQFWGDRLHEGQAFDPVMRDVEAMIESSQRRVIGDTRVRLDEGRFLVDGVRSPHSLMDRGVASYGESNRLWTGEEARSFASIAGIPSLLAAGAGEVPPW